MSAIGQGTSQKLTYASLASSPGPLGGEGLGDETNASLAMKLFSQRHDWTSRLNVEGNF